MDIPKGMRLQPRAWCEDRKTLYDVMSLVQQEQAPFCLCKTIDMDVSDAIPTNMLQFILPLECMDKNGNELWEGHIVRWIPDKNSTKYPTGDPVIGAIVYDGGTFKVMDKACFQDDYDKEDVEYVRFGSAGCNWYTIENHYQELEIIGDIFTDNHLLKEVT